MTAFVPFAVGLGLVSGFARELLLAYVFGTNSEVEIFRVAYALPSVVSEGVAVSVMSGLIPVLVARDRRGLSISLWASAGVGGLIAVVGAATMPIQAYVLAPGFSSSRHDLLVIAGAICWLMTALLLISYPLRADMNVDGSVWPSSIGTLLRNCCFALTFVVLVLALGAPSALWASVAAAVAGFLVLLIYVLIYRRVAERGRLSAALRCTEEMRDVWPVATTLAAICGAQVVFSGGRIIDRMVSSSLRQGDLASIEYSYAIIMTFAAVIGTSANLLLMPEVGRSVVGNSWIPRKYWRSLWSAVLTCTVVAIIGTLFSTPLVRLLYERGAFDPEATSTTAEVFSIQILGLPFLVGSLMLVQILIVSGRHSWFFRAAMLKLGFKVVALALAVRFIPVLQAIPASFAVAEALTFLVICEMVRRLRPRARDQSVRVDP